MSALYFYRVKNSDKIFLDRKQNNGDTPEIQKIKLPLLTRLFLWTQTTMFSFLCKSCRSEQHNSYLDVIDEANEKLEKDFDIKLMINNNKDLRKQIEVVKAKLNLQGHPKFDQLNENTIIDTTEAVSVAEKDVA